MTTKQRYRGVTEWFEQNVPDPRSELNYSSPYELLVAVMLSAQCTDKRVNMVTPALFKKYPSAEELSGGDVADIFELIRSISYPNAKAANLQKMARRLCETYNGAVPSTVAELETLAGVGRKTANVMVSIVFDTPAMAVDTHVFRVSARIGLTDAKATNPLEAERQLTANFDRKVLSKAHHWLILHGRYVCTARKPKCEECGIRNWCKFFENSIK